MYIWERAQDAILKFPGWEVVDYRTPKQGETFLSTLGPAQPTLCHITDWAADEPVFILRKVEPPNLSKYPGWVWTGEYRLPKAGEKILFNNGTFWVAQFDFERDRCYILKSAPVSPEPQPDREEAIRKAKDAAKYARDNGGCWNTPATLVVLAVEAIPDREPGTERGHFVHCDKCGKRVSTGSSSEILVRAWVECPECVGKEPDREPSPRVVWACPEEIVNSIKIFKKIIEGDHRLSPDIGLSATLTGKYQCLLDELLKGCRSTCVVWACPGEVIERIENIKRWADTWDKPGISDKCEKLLSLCHSTREATESDLHSTLSGRFLPENHSAYEISRWIFKIIKDAGYRVVKEVG